jgi:hypothetical protein
MEAILPNSITQLVIGIAAAIGMVAVSISTIGSAVAQLTVEQTEVPAKRVLTNRDEPPLSETDFRLSDHQQLRRIFLGH